MASEILSGLVVLNTRPSHQQQPLNDAITASGGKVVSMPLLRIEPLAAPADLQQINETISQLQRCSGLVFVSANAAALGAPLINKAQQELPSTLKLFAIGPSTAAELAKHFQQEVHQAGSGTRSEDLLALPELQKLDGEFLVIVRGRGGRETLRQTLEGRGAEVAYLEVYTREPEPVSAAQFFAVTEEAGVNALVVTSGESLQYMVALGADNKAALTLLPLIVPSSRIAVLAKQAGFSNVIEAAGAGEAAVVAALLTIADNFA